MECCEAQDARYEFSKIQFWLERSNFTTGNKHGQFFLQWEFHFFHFWEQARSPSLNNHCLSVFPRKKNDSPRPLKRKKKPNTSKEIFGSSSFFLLIRSDRPIWILAITYSLFVLQYGTNVLLCFLSLMLIPWPWAELPCFFSFNRPK